MFGNEMIDEASRRMAERLAVSGFAVRAYTGAGFDEVYIQQVGPDQEGFFEFYARDVLPRLRQE